MAKCLGLRTLGLHSVGATLQSTVSESACEAPCCHEGSKVLK